MIVLADSDPRFCERVADQLGRPRGLAMVDDVESLEAVVADRVGEVAVVLLGPNVPVQNALRATERLQRTAPEVSVIFVAQALTSDLLQSALRAGVRDCLPASFTTEQLAGAVERSEMLWRQIRERAGGGEPEASDHSITTVFSAKGGVGKSVIAMNLACVLARRTGREVALVDLDLQFGDLAIMMQLFPARTIYEASQSLGRLDAGALRGYLAQHRSNVWLLAAPLEPGLAETISADAVNQILRMLKDKFAHVIVDTPAAFTDHVVTALDESDHVVVITSMDVPTIKNQKLALQTIELLGIGRERVRLVLNRADSEVGLRVQEVEKTLGTVIDVQLPSVRAVPLSVNRGVPLAQEEWESPVIQALSQLAETLGATTAGASPQPPAQSGGRFRLRRRSA